ncbi:FCD domain-containing protein [Candidatus Albibeggiatoa sp. nov. NOAA]|uniref:FCD domain-containing protein n=1 Tax=Candidatus Albibeggiatoa sp. nov. NOAA TaxID=3162724 RepID=UPI0032F648FB|nr:FCD domain-containing protein [Thiotrichaceae bacterium]
MKQKISDKVAERLQEMLKNQTWTAGDKLPPERDLAKQLGVSRPSLREALQKLVCAGLLTTRHGGGTFVQEKNQVNFIDPLLNMFQEQTEAKFDVLEVRHALEGTAAYYAALRHTEVDRQRIQHCFDYMIEMHGSPNPLDEAKADAQFHLAISEAAYNPVLQHIMKNLFSLLENSITHNLDKLYTLPKVFEPLSHQHERMMNKVLERDADGARRAAQEHLVFVGESLQQIERAESRKLHAVRSLPTL